MSGDDRIPCLSPPGNDAGSHRAAVLAKVHEMARGAMLAAKGPVPPIFDPAWLEAEGWARIASLLVLAEAWLVEHWSEHDPDELKQASAAISGALDWSAEACQPSHATLSQRRTQPLYQRRCDTFGCRALLTFGQPPPPDVMIFGCEQHGGNVHGPPGWRDGP